MSQEAFLRDFDAGAFTAFADAGLADAATYLSPAARAARQAIADHDPDDPDAPAPPDAPVPLACTVLVDRNVEDFGDDLAPVSVGRTRLTVQRAEFEPEAGGKVTVGAAVYTLVQRTRSDESASAWWVSHE